MDSLLYKLYRQDQSERRKVFGRNGDKDASKEDIRRLERQDVQRQKILEAYLKKYLLKTAKEYYWVAMLFQHGKKVKDYQRAHRYAEKSRKLGYNPAAWLSAATLDRYLKSLGRRQKFGTQFHQRLDGEWRLWPILKRTTDQDRAKYGVESLELLLEFAKTLNKNRS